MDKVAAIIQARMGSSRLPGKVLMDICGHPMLWHVVTRAHTAMMLDEVIVATSTAVEDDAIVDFCDSHGIVVFRGSQHDVLDRYYQAAIYVGATTIVRITADCPLLDPIVVDKVISRFAADQYDYVSNVEPPTYPDGVNAEVCSFDALARTWREARWQSEREHVTLHMRKHPESFRTANVVNDRDLSSLRWTVDAREDLEFVRAVYEELGTDTMSMDNVLDLLERWPTFGGINARYTRGEGLLQSLRQDHLVQLSHHALNY